MTLIANELERITIGSPGHFGSLTLFPLFRTGAGDAKPGYLLLDEAIAQGTVQVTELSAGGSVPELRLLNSGDQPVLLLDGEELVGAKQNRAINLTILAPPKQMLVIPVSCVEAGRWDLGGLSFRAAPNVMYSRARAARADQISMCLARSGGRRSDQQQVWDEIEAKSQRLGAASPTRAMSAIYDSHAVSLDAYLRAFSWSERQAGVIFAIGSDSMGMDLLDCPETLRKLFPKLLRSYSLDALESERSVPASAAAAANFLTRVANAAEIHHPALGMGKDLRLSGNRIAGGALWAEERCIHLCAFAAGEDGGIAGQARMSRPGRWRTRESR